MRKLIRIIEISILIILILSSSVYGYENEIFKIEVPETYKASQYAGIYTFTKSDDVGIMIYTIKSTGLKKDISAMTKSEIKELIDKVVNDNVTVIEQKKEKLGKSKAIKARVNVDDEYMDMYILVSDKHVVVAGFVTTSEAQLDSQEFKQIKASFKMMEKTTNVTLIRIGILIAVGIGVVLKVKRKTRTIENL